MQHTRHLAIIWMALLGFSACGPGGNEDPVPPGSSVTINPQDITWEITPSASCVEGIYNDHTLTVTVQNGNGVPLGDVDLLIRSDLAANTSFVDVIRLYDDVNGNGVVDHPQELVSANNGPAFFTKTDKFSGSRTLLVRVNVSCTYRGSVTVHAGSAFGSTSIEVTDDTP